MLLKTYENIKWLPKNSKLEIYSDNKFMKEDKSKPVTSVFCFLFINKNELILVEHSNKSRGNDLPGGHIDDGENQIEALHRECLEEVGVKIKNIKPIGFQKIIKTIKEEKYPFLESYQSFFIAEINEKIPSKDIEIKNYKKYIINRKLEEDSNGSIIFKLEDFLKEKLENNIENPCYYLELIKLLNNNLKEELNFDFSL